MSMRVKILTLGLLVGIIVGAIGGFDLAGLGYVRQVTRTMTFTQAETSYTTSYTTSFTVSTVSLQPPKWLNRSQQVISYSDAGKYIGSTRTVEGTIVRTDHSNPYTIFLYFHDPYKGYLIIVIQRTDLPNFGFAPDAFYNGKEVRITGKIQLDQGSPEIVVRNPWQIEVAYMGFNYP
jgi:hypothetical protein